MTELFPDISDSFRKRVEFVVDMAFRQNTTLKAMQVIKNFSDTCSDLEKDFINFYLKLKVESLKK